ncbi:MAG: hypothetical protein GX171_08660 [Clostridiales bacterium]|jgi:polyhydroxyalkanoate synthesis regulator phasin|nr:hypothetical protein [Clostridiales bacterium]
MDQLDDKIRKIVMTGIGAIVETVEKSKDAIVGFAGSDQAKALVDKGEKAVQSALDSGSKVVKKVKDALSEAEVKDRVKKEKERLTNLAKQVSELSPDQLEVFEALVKNFKEKPQETSFGPLEGKHPQSEEALGKPGVTESDLDPDPDDMTSPDLAEKAKHDPLKPVTPTAPDDEQNAKRQQANAMNEHLKQNVPPDF